MSHWSFINGTLTIHAYTGETQQELDFIVKSVLSSLPDVNPSFHTKSNKQTPYFRPYPSEHHFDIFINHPTVIPCSSSHDTDLIYAGHSTYNLENKNRFVPNYSHINNTFHTLEAQTTYIITLHGIFRDAFFGPTLRDFTNWLNRLSTKLYISDMCVKVEGDRLNKTVKYIMTDDSGYWGNRYEGNEFEDMVLNANREKMMKIQGNKK